MVETGTDTPDVLRVVSVTVKRPPWAMSAGGLVTAVTVRLEGWTVTRVLDAVQLFVSSDSATVARSSAHARRK